MYVTSNLLLIPLFIVCSLKNPTRRWLHWFQRELNFYDIIYSPYKIDNKHAFIVVMEELYFLFLEQKEHDLG
jgi:hypothetical protein